MRAVEQSKSRARKTGMSLLALLGREGLAQSFPCGGLAFDLGKILVSHGVKCLRDRTEARISNFHSLLMRCDDSECSVDELLNVEFDIDDYSTILNLCIQDIEGEKVKIYAHFLRSIIINDLAIEVKRHYIKSCMEMTYYQLELMRRLYVRSEYDVMEPGLISKYMSCVLTSDDEFVKLSIAKIKSFGFIHAENNRLTEVGKRFVRRMYGQNELVPESIEWKRFEGATFAIVEGDNNGDMYECLCESMNNHLSALNIKCMRFVLSDKLIYHGNVLFGVVILIVDDGFEFGKVYSDIVSLNKSKVFVRINIGVSSADIALDNIDFYATVTLSCDDINNDAIIKMAVSSCFDR